MEAQADNGFFIFPEEIWELILEKLDKKDALNLLKAFPQLDDGLRKNKHLWLLEEVLPHVFQFERLLAAKDVLKCRQVCKRWREDVDNFLQNQINLPPSSVQQKDGSGVIYGRHSSPTPLRSYSYCGQRTKIEKLVWTVPTKEILVNSKEVAADPDAYKEWGNSLTKFLKKMKPMKDLPPESNPFPSRRILIETYYDEYVDDSDYLKGFWVDVVKLFQKFGRHVWTLNLAFRNSEDEDDYTPLCIVWTEFLKCLHRLPNLRSLHFTGDGGIERTRRNSFATKAFPHLPDLKEIQLSLALFPKELETLLLRYLPQLEKLNLPEICWNPVFPKKFRNLQDLTLTAIENTEVLTGLLLCLRAPCLARLNLELGERRPVKRDKDKCDTHRLKIVRDIFPILKHFQSLRVFGIDARELKHIQLTNSRLPSKQRFPNIQFLKIPDSYFLTYDFLLCFPALREFHIKVESTPMVLDNSNCLNSLVRIRNQLDTGKLYESNIWQLLPALEKMGLEIGPGHSWYLPSCHKYFSRERYDYLTKSGETSPKDSHPLREDIQKKLIHLKLY